jgi:hypothetical protein
MGLQQIEFDYGDTNMIHRLGINTEARLWQSIGPKIRSSTAQGAVPHANQPSQ